MKKANGHNVQWKTVKLGDCCTIHGRIGFRGYTTDDLVEKGYGAITFSPSDIHDFKLNYDNCDYISWNKYEESPEIKVFNGDILFCKTASIGKCAIVENLKEKATINPQFVILKDFVCNPKYLYYKLISYDFQTQVQGITGGSTIKTMSQEKLKLEPILFPVFPDGTHNLPAQRRIAAILSSADKVIEQTRQLIGKYKSIKQGMMEDLLKPKEGWKKVKLGEVGTFKNGINKDKSQFGFGTLYVSISDAYYENIDFKKLNRLNATEKEIEEYLLVDDDIVFVRSSVKPSGVGYTTLFRHYEKEPVLFSGFMIRYRLNDKVNNSAEFLNYLFRSEEFRRQVIGKSTVSANTNVNQESLKELVCFIPDFPEQRRIAKILSGIDRKIEAEEKVLEKYEKMKKGLMEKLFDINN